MTYIELYENATRQLEKSEITLGEYEEMINPLDREIIITCKDCNNHGINIEHHDIDGARYCSTLHTYTGYDFYCADAERKRKESSADDN